MDNFQINTKCKIPSEQETRVKILSIAQVSGCYPEVKQLLKKYDQYKESDKFDPRASPQIAASLIKELADINIYLVSWLADEQGNIRVNDEIAFVLEEVPDIF